MQEKKVYIILINVCNWEDTIECINSIFKNNYTNYQLIIVENSKEELSLKKIKQYLQGEYIPNNTNQNKFYEIESKNVPYKIYDRKGIENQSISCTYCYEADNKYLKYPVIIIRNNKISGFSENNNLGLKYALLKNDFEYIWILNNDTVIKKDALSMLIKEFDTDEKCGVVGSTIRYYNNPDIIQCVAGSRYYYTLGFGRGFLKNKPISVIDNIDKHCVISSINTISGCSFFFRKEVICDVGLMDEDYFLYGEDMDYFYRIVNAGWRYSISLKSYVFHKANSVTKKKSKDFYYFHNSRSSILFAKKHLPCYYSHICIIPILINTFRKTFSLFSVISSLKGIKEGFGFFVGNGRNE